MSGCEPPTSRGPALDPDLLQTLVCPSEVLTAAGWVGVGIWGLVAGHGVLGILLMVVGVAQGAFLAWQRPRVLRRYSE